MTARPEHFRKLLEAERAELLAASEGTSESRKPVELDQQSVGRVSRGDAMQVQAMAKAQDARRAARIKMIDAALKRIDDGDYGYCVECGEEIAEGRLEADPAAPRCVACAG
jgi:DnaK suppressor protein